jgi:hypothetical protein
MVYGQNQNIGRFADWSLKLPFWATSENTCAVIILGATRVTTNGRDWHRDPEQGHIPAGTFPRSSNGFMIGDTFQVTAPSGAYQVTIKNQPTFRIAWKKTNTGKRFPVYEVPDGGQFSFLIEIVVTPRQLPRPS